MNEAKHGDYAGVVDIARNGVDEIIRLNRQSNDLALLVKRLVRRLTAARLGAGSQAGDDQLSREALNYLRRKGLLGDPLRLTHNTCSPTVSAD